MQSGDWSELNIRVYYEDTDAQGVVYFANYLRFMERGRTEWLRDKGIEQARLSREQNLCFSLVTTNAKFLRPARFDDELVVLTRVTELKGARVSFEQRVCKDNAAGELLCQADCLAACVSADTFKPRRLPETLLTES
jgi:tol-pal system-associated acyl-CoA thioesterase